MDRIGDLQLSRVGAAAWGGWLSLALVGHNIFFSPQPRHSQLIGEPGASPSVCLARSATSDTTNMFWKLPREVFDLIIGQLPHNDLVALSAASKTLRAVLSTIIWKKIRVDVQSRGASLHQPRVDGEAVARCAATLRQPSTALREATQLDLQCGFANRHYLGTPCPHPLPGSGEDQAGRPLIQLTEAQEKRRAAHRAEREAHYRSVVENAQLIIESLEKGQLQGFSWDLVTCVPPSIIKALAEHHPHITSLRLTTDCMCPGPPGAETGVVDLTPFRCLKCISWKGLPPYNARQLREAIRDNQHHLEELELDLHNIYPPLPPSSDRWWQNPSQFFPEEERFRDDILAMRPYRSLGPAFPALRVLRLRLTPLDLGNTRRTLCRIINFAALESLTLWHCRGWEGFLEVVRGSMSGKSVKLRTLEVKCDEHNSGRGITAISSLLLSCRGLVDLFVSVSNSGTCENPGPSVWYALQHLQDTLKRLVIHWRADFGCRPRYVRDSHVLGLSMAQLRYEPLGGLGLECLGLCCDPELLPMLLRPFTFRPKLKIFHLRQTGADLNRGEDCLALDLPRVDEPGCRPRERHRVTSLRALEYDTLEDALQDSFRALLDWAFGPNGIASLEVVAFGDFGQGRNKLYLHNLFVCRTKSAEENNGLPYRVFDARDRKHEHRVPKWKSIASVQAGLPQGSPLSPILFLFFNADLVQRKIDSNGGAIAFVDDFTAWVTGPTAQSTRKGIEAIIDQALDWEKRSGATFEADKTAVIHFTRKAYKANSEPFTIKGQDVQPKDHVKILGVVMDAKLRYKEHIARAASKGLSAAMELKRLSGLSPATARQLFTAMVAPVVDYASSVWMHQCNWKTVPAIHRVQRVAAQGIIGTFSTVATRVAEAEAHIPTAQDRFWKRAIKMWTDIHTLPETNPLRNTTSRMRKFRRSYRSPFFQVADLLKDVPLDSLETIAPVVLAPWERRVRTTVDRTGIQQKKTEWAVRIAVSSSARNNMVGIGGVVRLPLPMRDGSRNEAFSVTLGSRSEQNPFSGELAAIGILPCGQQPSVSHGQSGHRPRPYLTKWGRHSKRVDIALPGKHTQLLYDHLSRSEAGVLAQLRTGMAKLNTYLHRIKAAPSDQCTCGQARETVNHFLFRCKQWDQHRREMLQCTDVHRGNLSFYLGGKSPSDDKDWSPNMRAVRATIRFAIATGRLRTEQQQNEAN
ncbi:hypothetical protein CHGG_08482 [Chaetomium globosum CBS 148.51]|uniref:F-box domain-containing protein n=1 Tax=Chaetomium globosum (strain ATCC 6205 / CBS 148.51 / DSM 1962 / NBRC 6347 / NRRL 1970) TaxID=306901 RepID=Q2GU72_CHAGB|nr:uncharacterized protein CHGG_08482 [Chaetomium globosum CBS 148.51]EAQ84468.1 hypothetical protein CHGG_08482 [Chaetomium globosum CBS 148.51]